MSITIRKIVKQDCKPLLDLIYELAVYERAPEQLTVTLQHFEESGFGANPVWWGFVAEENNIILGFALYYIRYSTWKGRRLYLEDILVTEAMRGQGIDNRTDDRVRKGGVDVPPIPGTAQP